MMELQWTSSPITLTTYPYTTTSEVDSLKREIELQARTIENL